jgi:hypothetical protein
MFKRNLVNLHAEIDLPRNRYYRELEDIARDLEHEAKELTEFIRDHRNRDSYDIRIIREYESRCEYCGYLEERDIDGKPVCCEKAIAEFDQIKFVNPV